MTSQSSLVSCPVSLRTITRCTPVLLVGFIAASIIFVSLPPIGRAQNRKPTTTSNEDANRVMSAFQEEYVPGEVLVAFQPGASRREHDALRGSLRASVIKEMQEIRLQHWRLPPGLEVERAVQILSANPNVKYAEPNYIVSADQLPGTPNDSHRSDLWGMHNVGQSGGTTGADINAPEAWNVSTGSSDVVVGVIDTGIDYNHPDLQNNVWSNPGETGLDSGGNNKATNGIDDDNNGYVDDFRGWDFANNDNDPFDDNGHGTHTSGTIGAQGNNSIGVVGVNWNVQIMPLKFLGAGGSGDTAGAVNAMLYAAKFKTAGGANLVRVTSNSWSGGKRSSALQDAIAGSGALVVAAAGNGGSNQAVFPAGFNNANIISVAATDHNDSLATFSNYSSSWVDLAAPGVNVISTWPNNQYRSLNGTSMACPHVAGVAALIMAAMPSLSNTAVKTQIMNTVDLKSSLAGKTVTGGRINAGRAVQSALVLTDNCAAAPCSPADVTDLSVDNTAATPTSVTLRLTASGDDGATGSAYVYDVRYSSAPINAGNFAQATVANGETVPQPAGSPDSIVISNLKPETTYYFALRVGDETGLYSTLAFTSGATAPGVWDTNVIEDTADDLAFSNSLAYDKSANPAPAIAYSNSTLDDLKFAHWNGSSWDIQTVDAGTGSRAAISLVYDPAGNPSISYGLGALKFAQWVPATQSWQITTIESRYVNTDFASLAYDPDGNPAIAYRTLAPKGSALKLARRTATGWTIQTVTAALTRYCSLAFDANGNPSVAYSEDIDGDGWLDTLKFARLNGSSWVIQTVETGVVGYGVFASLAYDNSGYPAIVHRGGAVRFVRWNGTSWDAAEIVSNGYNPWLIFDPSEGSFYVSYNDETNLWIGKRSAGAWTYEQVDIGVGVRSVSKLAMSSCGSPSVSYSTRPNNDLKFATKCPLPGP